MWDGSYPRSTYFIRQDKLSVYDWEELNSNPKEFKEIIEKHKQDGDNIVLWICSFCESRNVI